MPEFHADVRVLDGTGVLELHGDVDRRAADALPAAYDAAVAAGATAILLDFAATDFINSTGIALIVGLLAQARTDGRRVLVCGLSDHYMHIFQITRLADFTTFYPDVASAVGRTPSAT